MAKWNPDTVRMDVDQRGIKTAYVTLYDSKDAHEVIERLHGIDWYNMRMIVRHAMGEEVRFNSRYQNVYFWLAITIQIFALCAQD